MDRPRALYEQDGRYFVPSALTRGPWHPNAQHGGAPGALLATCAERIEGGEEMTIARLTIELLRPVPLSRLSIESAVERPGRKVQVLALSLHSDETEVARARVLRIRTKPIDLPANLTVDAAPPGAADGAPSLPAWDLNPEQIAFHSHAVEHRFVSGAFNSPGPGTDWIRLRCPVIDGEEIRPIARALAAADFGNGVSWEVDRREGYSFINPDLTVYLDRMPRGDAVCLQSRSRYQPNGVGFAESLLWDKDGPIGRSIQSLLVDHNSR